MLTLGPLGFATPWALAALPLLPALWWWLRQLPPAPRTVIFPAVRLLAGLKPPETRPARAPWWLLLLRLALLVALLLALAGPVLHPAETLAGRGPLVLVLDNGWAAAPHWSARQEAVRGWINRAERENRRLAVLATAPATVAATRTPPAFAVMSAAEARRWVETLAPQPWPADREGALAALSALAGDPAFAETGGLSSVWFSDGLKTAGAEALLARLRQAGTVVVLSFPPEALPHILASETGGGDGGGDDVRVRIARADSRRAEQVAIRALADDGRLLGREIVPLAAGQLRAEAVLALPADLRRMVASLRIEQENHAAAVALLDGRWRRRPVGFPEEAGRGDSQPYTRETYFLERALAPFHPLRHGPIPTLLAEGIALLAVADIGTFADADAAALSRWVENGGVLVRFAGPRLAGREPSGGGAASPSGGGGLISGAAESGGNAGRRGGGRLAGSAEYPQGADGGRARPVDSGGMDDPLLPVRLRPGERQLGGALSWAEPAGLAPFPPGSPFSDLAVPGDIRVFRQVLADPAGLTGSQVWATLADGTPFITARRLGHGWRVLIHTTANADWSNFALSGLFVQVLQRLADLSEGLAPAEAQQTWVLRQKLDGFGQLSAPSADAEPLPATAFATVVPGPRHPPGLYEAGESRRVLGLGGRLPPLAPLGPLPDRFPIGTYPQTQEVDLQPFLLGLAVLLLTLDSLLILGGRGGEPGATGGRAGRAGGKGGAEGTGANPSALRRRVLARLRVFFLVALVPPAGLALSGASGLSAVQAAERPLPMGDSLWQAVQETRLAYILTGDPAVDRLSRAGLRSLGRALRERTAVEPAEEPAAVRPGQDVLAVYPLLYWPLTENQDRLGEPEQAALADFLRNGGVLLLDSRDQGMAAGEGGGPRTSGLGRLLRGLDLPPLTPVPADHVLGRSFYLLSSFPGRVTGGAVWVESRDSRDRDGVSALILGSHDWAAAWAHDDAGRPLLPVIPGGEMQREQALRFGINLVMYALSGNYKADQVHVPALLERLGP